MPQLVTALVCEITTENGTIVQQRFKQMAYPFMRHNPCGPALINYYLNGQVQSETWIQFGKQYNSTGKASYREYDQDGALIHEEWTDQDGVLHRDNGPSIIKYTNGRITSESYYLRGVEHTQLEYYLKSHAIKDGIVVDFHGKKYHIKEIQ